MRPLILASASPQRKKLLKEASIPFTVDTAHIEENLTLTMPPLELARFLSFKKAEEVGKRHAHHLILGADTLVVVDGRCLGKPRTKKEALTMLRALNGKTHQVITGFTLLETDENGTMLRGLTHAVVTFVQFKKNPLKTLKAYVQTNEPMGKAGAYAIQGKGAALIEKIEGSHSNVVGLPMEEVKAALKKART